MKLYHGTSESRARKIIREGLRPRSELSGDSSVGNWKHTIDSHPDRVYLTDCYAPYFAMASSGDGERWAIIEIETDELDEFSFVPDEDFLEQATRQQDAPADWVELGFPEHDEGEPDMQIITRRTAWFRDHAEMFASHWRDSVSRLGTCAYHGDVGPHAITRAVLYEPYGSNGHVISMAVADPCITLLNATFMGDNYRAKLRWFFEPIDAAQFDPFMQQFAKAPSSGGGDDNTTASMIRDRQAIVETALADRSRLEVLK